MTVSIIGWYGTETQGDIAILDGILSILSELDSSISVKLGSLYSFYTERTLLLNKDIFKYNSPNVDIEIFNVKDSKERNHFVKKSDLLLIGGGPLDNIAEMVLLEKCFYIAKKNKVKTMVCGCGIDVITKAEIIKSLANILEKTDLIVVRNEKTKQKMQELFALNKKIYVLNDPAVLSMNNYLRLNKEFKKNNSISINLRKYPIEEYINPVYYGVSDYTKFIENLSDRFEAINLIPMHSFFIGGDDRLYLIDLAYNCKNTKVNVIQKPQSLYELYSMYQSSAGCVGMRYHSVVMQTIINGNNIIFDYTDEKTGKIADFLRNNQIENLYTTRICHLQDPQKVELNSFIFQLLPADKFSNSIKINDNKNEYLELIKRLFY